jgi:outer membrane protein
MNMLKYLMGIDADRNIVLSGDLVTLNPHTIAVGTDFGNQIEMRILEQKKELVKMNIKLAQAAFRPSVSAYAGYSYQSPVDQLGDMGDENNWYKSSFIGIRLTVPIFEGNRNKSKVNQGKIELEQAKAVQQDLQNELDIKLKNAFQKYSTNLSSEIKQKNNMDLAENVFKMTNQQYGQGLKSFTDVLNARSEYNASHRLWLNSILQIKLSELEIMKINGTIHSLFF